MYKVYINKEVRDLDKEEVDIKIPDSKRRLFNLETMEITKEGYGVLTTMAEVFHRNWTIHIGDMTDNDLSVLHDMIADLIPLEKCAIYFTKIPDNIIICSVVVYAFKGRHKLAFTCDVSDWKVFTEKILRFVDAVNDFVDSNEPASTFVDYFKEAELNTSVHIHYYPNEKHENEN